MSFNFDNLPHLRGQIRSVRRLNENFKPRVTIVTPFYNSHEFLEETSKSVLSQTLADFEWIIVNDGSTNEDSIRFLGELATQDPRIRVVNKPNGGLSSARNFGFNAAQTEHVVPLDADDLIEPTYLEICWWALQSFPGASWSYTDTIGFGDHTYLWRKDFNVEALKHNNFLVATAMIKKSAWADVGGYDESLRHGYEDWHFWLKLVKNGHFPVHVKHFGFWYRRRPNSMLRTIEKTNQHKEHASQVIKQLADTIPADRVKAIELNGMHFDGSLIPIPPAIKKETPISVSDMDKKHITILFIFPWLNMGGADKFNLDLISGLDKNRYRSIICTTVPSEHVWQAKFEQLTDEIYHLPNFLSVERWSQFIVDKINQEKVDIVFVSNSEWGYYALPWIHERCPSVSIVDYVHMEEKYWKNGGYARMSSDVSTILHRTYVTSYQLKQTLIDEYGRDGSKIDVAYINVDAINTFNPDLITYGTKRREVGIDDQTAVILFPCRLHQQKRPYLMLEIAKKLKENGQKFQVWVVGDGPEETGMKQFVEKNGMTDHIVFWGPVADVRPYYRDADLTLICSIKEGISLTTYESMAMGVPVITSDVGGQKEVVKEGTGYVVPLLVDEKNDYGKTEFKEEEISLYVELLKRLIQEPSHLRQLGVKSRKRITEHFLLDHMIQFFDQEFQRLTSESRSNVIFGLGEPLLRLYLQLLRTEQISEEIWQARCYFERLAKQGTDVMENMARYRDKMIMKIVPQKVKEYIKWKIFKQIR